MQNEILQNPDMIRNILDNPVVQRIMNDPENMRALMTRNPQMQELMERNPEISHMLNNPELLRQTMELARNPSMLQELMRTHDRAISNLESIPGGYNALQRMYRDIQEPMLSATADQFLRNPFAGLVDNSSPNNPQQGRENTEPLPNPWNPQRSNTNTNTSSTPAPGGVSPSMANLLQNLGSTGGIPGSGTTPNLENMSPVVDMLLQDPSIMDSIVGSSPMFQGNPEMREQMRMMMPQILQQMQNPEMMNMMSNPQTLQAIMQIQQGLDTLRQTAPNLIPSMTNIPGSVPSTTSTTGITTSTTSPTTGTTGTTPTTTTTTPSAPNQQQANAFSEVSVN